MSQMTDKEYVEDGGQHCPFCRSENIQGGSLQAEGRTAWQSVSCDDCGRGWQDTYQMTGWTDEFNDNED
jgi:transposase-like protein